TPVRLAYTDVVFLYRNLSILHQGADGLLVVALADLVDGMNILRAAAVAQGGTAAIALQVSQDPVSQIVAGGLALQLQRQVNASVLAHAADIALELLADAQRLQHLALEYKPQMSLVDDRLVAHLRSRGDQQVDRLHGLKAAAVFAEKGIQPR